MDLNQIFNEALTVRSAVFLNLISQVNQILTYEAEAGCIGELRITGRLIRIPPRGEVIVIGDIHGDLESLNHILSTSNFIGKILNGLNVYLIFLGDYGDRGEYSPEVYHVTLTLKKLFPEKVILLQGNHEGPEDLLAYPHDLPYQMRRKFGSEGLTIYKELADLFRRFYTAVLVKDKYVMLHGGVPSEARSLEDVAFAYIKHPAERHLEEILWSDPSDWITGKYPSPRGAGYLFGKDITAKFLKLLDVKFLIRGHEPADEGYKFNHDGRILTLFSMKGPPYYNSNAAYLMIDLALQFNYAEEIKMHIKRF
ncbi:MAG: metallophosphoesterase family protein [Candidatus Bathyarchaeia archaeon]